jgi:DNA-binding CsgD family transcriptional regulator
MRGDVDRGRAAGRHALRITEEMGLVHRLPAVRSAMALLELSLPDAAAAYGHLEPVLGLEAPGQSEPALQRPMIPLAVEALVGLGRLDEAEAMLRSYERLARRQRRAVSISDAQLCRAMLEAAGGEVAAAEGHAQQARDGFVALAMPFEAARASLVLGEVRRRGRRKASAREAVAAALSGFDALGAARWADRARAELGRTEPRRAPGAELTETEQHIADLVAEGQTNREIAGTLFMSVHTVEAHLTRVYRAMGVRSRTELARRMRDRGAQT